MIIKVKKDFFDRGVVTFYIEESVYEKIQKVSSALKEILDDDHNESDHTLLKALYDKSQVMIDFEGGLIKSEGLNLEGLIDKHFEVS